MSDWDDTAKASLSGVATIGLLMAGYEHVGCVVAGVFLVFASRFYVQMFAEVLGLRPPA